MLTGLRHRTVSRATYQDSTVHLSSTGDHVLNVVGVSRAVYVRVVAGRGLVFNVRGGDGDTTLTLFRSVVDTVEGNGSAAPHFGTYASQRSGQGGFTMVNVTDGAHVYVGLGTFKLFFSHCGPPNISVSRTSDYYQERLPRNYKQESPQTRVRSGAYAPGPPDDKKPGYK